MIDKHVDYAKKGRVDRRPELYGDLVKSTVSLSQPVLAPAAENAAR